MKTMLRPDAFTPRSTSNRRCTSGGDKAEVGSSRMTMRAPENSTRASSISCCRPIASEPMRALGSASMPRLARCSRAPSTIARQSTIPPRVGCLPR